MDPSPAVPPQVMNGIEISPAIPPPVNDGIRISETEAKIFVRLMEVLRHFHLETQVRVAGGWVRDKLLGKECYDIDIALDDLLGKNFCEKIIEYSRSLGEKRPLGEKRQDFEVISSNPDQSKHLETARMQIYDTSIDFVNLRSETYDENSRIPKMKFGPAEEDAYRRDLTINSLFYNVNNKSLEDLTGRGIKDLKSGLIITPLPPKSTFLDDPLRVLRAIRFGARFNFKLDEELKAAASDDEVRSALVTKISRERIGHEVDLMMSGKQPAKAMGYIRDLKLFLDVFAFPQNPKPPVDEHCDRICVSHIEAAWDLLQLIGPSIFSDEQRRLYLSGSLFAPLRSTIYLDKKSKEIPVSAYIIKESLKLKASDADTVVKLHKACEKFLQLFALLESYEGCENTKAELEDEFLEIPSNMVTRVFAGVLLDEIKDFWRVALLISVLLKSESDLSSIDKLKEPQELNKQREMFLRVETAITQLDLDGVWTMKPLLDGNVVMKILKLQSGGSVVGDWKKRVTKWQLANRKGTTEECISWIQKSTHEKYTI